jgi:hypothetical protein
VCCLKIESTSEVNREKPVRVLSVQGAIGYIGVEVQSPPETKGIFTHEPSSRWIVVSGAVIRRTAQIVILGGGLKGQSCRSARSLIEVWPTFALTVSLHVPKLAPMVVHLKPETESRLKELSLTTGRAPDELIEDAMAGFLAELAQIRGTLDGRYDEIKRGRVKPIDGEEAFNRVREKSESRRRS